MCCISCDRENGGTASVPGAILNETIAAVTDILGRDLAAIAVERAVRTSRPLLPLVL